MDETISVALINALIPVFLTTVTAVIGFVGNELRKQIAARTTNDQVEFLQRVAAIGVQAAEQLFGELAGEEKKAFALQYIQAELDKRGIKLDAAQLEALVEATVLEQFNWPAVEPTPPTETVTTPDLGGNLPPLSVNDYDTGDNA